MKHIDVKSVNVTVDGEQRKVFVIEVQSKGEKTTGRKEFVYVGTERLKAALQERRFALRRDPEAYVFGTEDGRDFRTHVAGIVLTRGVEVGSRSRPRLAHAAN